MVKKVKEENEDDIEETIDNVKKYICPYCDKTYSRRESLHKHLKTCSEKPDEKQELETENEGVKMFKDTSQKEVEKTEEYPCPGCNFIGTVPYDICPICGVEIEWSD